MRGKIKLYGCGGAGINVVADIFKELSSLGDSFAEFNQYTLDTTEKTIQNYPEINGENFFKITSSLVSQEELDGMAGERNNPTLALEIQKSVRVFMDKAVKKNEKHHYHCVIFSASGGSGSMIGPLLIQEMMKKDMNVIPIVILDSSTLLNTNNSIKTLGGMYKNSLKMKRAIALAYFINNAPNTSTTKSGEKVVNGDIKKMLKILSVFVSGSVHDIDNQDMNNFISPSVYTSFDVEPGLYSIAGKINKITSSTTIMARTLLKGNEDVQIDVTLTSNKTGRAYEEHVQELGENLFPLFLTIEKDVVANVVGNLQEIYKEQEKVKQTKTSALDMVLDDMDDDTGLAL